MPEEIQKHIKDLKDGDWNVRKSAADALGEIGPEAIPALAVALKDKNEIVRHHAAWAINEIGGTDAVPALIGALKNTDVGVRWIAAAVLGNMPHADAVPALVEALKDWNRGVRDKAAISLGEIGHPDAVPALIEALKDEYVRDSARVALGKIGAPGLQELIRAHEDAEDYVRKEIEVLIENIGRGENAGN